MYGIEEHGATSEINNRACNPLAAVAHGHTLAEAIVDTVREPLVVLDRDLRVIWTTSADQ